MERMSINSSLPPLKCAYMMAPINEETPYIAMEEMVSDARYKRVSEERSKCCSLFCFQF